MKATVTPGKPRIPYIDFMKGLCIMLIVMTHVEGTFFDQLLPNLNNALQSFRIPLYYFLSGLFFKTYGGISDFSRKKVNNLLIPFVFFHVLCCATTLIIFELKEHFVRPQEIKFVWTCFIEPLYLRDWHYTVPLWFLLSLFEVNIIYYCLQRWLRPWAVMSMVALVSVAGYLLFLHHIELPLHFDTAMVGLPYFVLGSMFKQHGALEPKRFDRWLWVMAIPLFIGIYFVAQPIDIHMQVVPHYLLLYGVPFVAISTLFAACKPLGYVPVICYWGRYSLIILGTHATILEPVKLFFNHRGFSTMWVAGCTFVVTMAIATAAIWLCIRWFPKFTAQQEFFGPQWKVSLP